MEWKDLQSEPTIDLISFVKSKVDPGYLELASAAFVALTFRFRQKLINQCTVVCRKRKLTEDDAIELSNRIFDRFWKYPKFQLEKSGSNKSVDNAFLRYLNGIGNREILGLIYQTCPIYTGVETIVTSLIDPTVDHPPEKLKILQAHEARLDEIFSILTEKHKIIYLTYKTYEIPNHNLPTHLLKAMQEQLFLTQSTIRVYKKEAFELVNNKLTREKDRH